MTKLYELNYGIKVRAEAESCLFCEHCTDIFYDSKGVYMLICAKDKDVVVGSQGKCSYFENEAGEST